MKYKTEIWISYNYGGWSLIYSKVFDLPFVPFFGLGLIFDDANEYEIKLENSDSFFSLSITNISYNIEKEQFEVDIRNVWKKTVSDDTIDSVIKKFSNWEKRHNTDIDSLKNLMKRNNG